MPTHPGNKFQKHHVQVETFERIKPAVKLSHRTPTMRELIMQKLGARGGAEAQPGTVDQAGEQQ